MQCSQCSRPVSENVTACPGCGADLSYAVIGGDGNQYGPYSLTTVRRCLAEGRITPASLVSQGGKPWVVAEQVLPPEAAPPMPRPSAPSVSRGRPQTDSARIILIVVGIVVALTLIGAGAMAVVLRASFGQARGKARTASCLSNLKQLALGMHMFASDHGETFPDAGTWREDIQPYCKNRQLLVCPASNRGEESYEMNPQLSNGKLAEITRPMETPLIYEAGFPDGDPPHPHGWVVAFADGHAKCIPASQAAAYR